MVGRRATCGTCGHAVLTKRIRLPTFTRTCPFPAVGTGIVCDCTHLKGVWHGNTGKCLKTAVMVGGTVVLTGAAIDDCKKSMAANNRSILQTQLEYTGMEGKYL